MNYPGLPYNGNGTSMFVTRFYKVRIRRQVSPHGMMVTLAHIALLFLVIKCRRDSVQPKEVEEMYKHESNFKELIRAVKSHKVFCNREMQNISAFQ